MNICLLNDSFPPVIDGVSNTVKNYARILSETEGDSIIVATPRYPGADYSEFPYHVVPYRSLNTSALIHGYRTGDPFSLEAMEKLIEFAPDVIHTHCPMVSTIMARILREQTGAPIILTYHTKFEVDIARAVKARVLQRESIDAMVDNISACDEVWTVSRGAGENLVSLGYKGEYRVVSNGVDFEKGRVSSQLVKEATAGYDLPEGIPVFLFVGRIMTYKGLPIIVDALKLLHDDDIDFRMVFVGDGVDKQAIEKMVSDYGIGDKVIFTGAVHDRLVLRAWDTRADLFLFPSTYDTNGIVVREAAACGLASVLIKGSCAAEDVVDGRNGYLIDENAESMAALLKKISTDINALRETGQRAMDELYLSWNDAARIARGYYEEILEKKKSGELDRNREKTATDKLFDMAAKAEDANLRLREYGRSLAKSIKGTWQNIENIVLS